MPKIDITNNMAQTPTSRGVCADAQGALSSALANKHYQKDILIIATSKLYINEKNYLTKVCYQLYRSGWYLTNKSITDIIIL